MINSKFEERRQAVRAKRILSVRYRLHRSQSKAKDSAWYFSTTEDMSSLGLTFTTNRTYRAGDILELNVILAGVLDIFRGYGRVVRCEKKAKGDYFKIAVEYSQLKARRSNPSIAVKRKKAFRKILLKK